MGGHKENERVGKFLFGPVVIIHVQREHIGVCDDCIDAYQQSKYF